MLERYSKRKRELRAQHEENLKSEAQRQKAREEELKRAKAEVEQAIKQLTPLMENARKLVKLEHGVSPKVKTVLDENYPAGTVGLFWGEESSRSENGNLWEFGHRLYFQVRMEYEYGRTVEGSYIHLIPVGRDITITLYAGEKEALTSSLPLENIKELEFGIADTVADGKTRWSKMYEHDYM